MPELQNLLVKDLHMSNGSVNLSLKPHSDIVKAPMPQWSKDLNQSHNYQHRTVTNRLNPGGGSGQPTDRSDSAIDSNSATARDSEQGQDYGKFTSTTNENAEQRVRILENRIEFLTRQHADMLQSLHEEVDMLKRKNRELQTELAVQRTQPIASASGQLKSSSNRSGRVSRTGAESSLSKKYKPLKASSPEVCSTAFMLTKPRSESAGPKSRCENKEKLKEVLPARTSLEGSLKELAAEKKTLNRGWAATTFDSSHRKEVAPKTKPVDLSAGTLYATPAAANNATAPTVVLPPVRGKPSRHSQLVDFMPGRCLIGSSLPFNATVEPFLVQMGTKTWRPPTVEECRLIVKGVLEENYRLRRETSSIRQDLQNVQPVRKSSESDTASVAASEIISPLTFPQRHRSPSPHTARSVSPVTLPPLRPPPSSRTAEQIRRSQFLAKRLKETIDKVEESKQTKKH